MNWLYIAMIFDILIGLLHLVIVFFLGADGYRFFGAGEKFATMAEAGKLFPHIVTLGIAIVFFIFAYYAYAGMNPTLFAPYLKGILMSISAVFILRGIGGIPLYFAEKYSLSFILWTSGVSFSVGLFHVFGLIQNWDVINR